MSFSGRSQYIKTRRANTRARRIWLDFPLFRNQTSLFLAKFERSTHATLIFFSMKQQTECEALALFIVVELFNKIFSTSILRWKPFQSRCMVCTMLYYETSLLSIWLLLYRFQQKPRYGFRFHDGGCLCFLWTMIDDETTLLNTNQHSLLLFKGIKSCFKGSPKRLDSQLIEKDDFEVTENKHTSLHLQISMKFIAWDNREDQVKLAIYWKAYLKKIWSHYWLKIRFDSNKDQIYGFNRIQQSTSDVGIGPNHGPNHSKRKFGVV